MATRNFSKQRTAIPVDTAARRRIPIGGARIPPTREQIAQRAYEIFERRGRLPGHETEDWLQAEAELRGDSPTESA